MELEVSLLCSQEPSTGPYREPDQSNPYHTIPSYLSKHIKVYISKVQIYDLFINIIIKILILLPITVDGTE
jgi:hypothetical protein